MWSFYGDILFVSQSLWPRVLRRLSAAARLLGLWVRIPSAARTSLSLSLSCKCYVLSGRGPCDGPITCPEEFYRVCECDRGTSLVAVEPKEKLYSFIINSDLVDWLVMRIKNLARDMSRSESAVLLAYFCQLTVRILLAYSEIWRATCIRKVTTSAKVRHGYLQL